MNSSEVSLAPLRPQSAMSPAPVRTAVVPAPPLSPGPCDPLPEAPAPAEAEGPAPPEPDTTGDPIEPEPESFDGRVEGERPLSRTTPQPPTSRTSVATNTTMSSPA